MVQEPTTFVLGAGASWPYGFPTADELRNQIVSGSWRDRILQGLAGSLEQEMFGETAKTLERSLKYSGRSSIDAFLEGRPEHTDLGKLAISACLTPKESDCFAEPRGGDWYRWLFDRMYKDCDAETFARSNHVQFVTFNYDRSLEIHLTAMLSNSSGTPLQQCWETVNTLKIHHVYGKLDSQVLLSRRSETPQVDSSLQSIRGAATGIRIMSDERSLPDEDTLTQACISVREASVVVFLGFGFDKTNMVRIGIDPDDYDWTVANQSIRFYATAFNLWEKEIQAAISNVGSGFSNIGDRNDDCLQFLRRYVSLV